MIFCQYLLFYFVTLLYFDEVKKFKVVLKARSAMRRLVRMCLAQSGYGSRLLSLAYYRLNNCLLNSISKVLSLK